MYKTVARIISLAALLVLLTVPAAHAQTAKAVLDRAAAKLQKAGGLQASFECTNYRGTTEQGTTRGTIQVQGQKFRIASQGGDVWFDGKNQWSQLSGSDEVNLTTPTKAEVQQMNPYHFVNLYKQGYTLSLSSASYQGRTVQKVDMVSSSAKQPIQKMTILLDQNDTPLNIRLKDSKGNWTRFKISGLKTGQKFSADTFQYRKEDHPDIEVIDLR